MTAQQPMAQIYFTSDLFNLFKTICGGCHVESNLGSPPFVVSEKTFPMVVDMSVVDRIISPDPAMEMPPPAPGAPLYSMRPDTDPTHQLADLLTTWIMQGRPVDSFTLNPTGSSTTSSSSSSSPMMADYTLTPDLGNALTNIGSCVPAGTIGQNLTTMDQMDSFWASAKQLPDTLAETDLTTLDSMTLAANGVISYAPTYPLWSDNSGKMRYIRVPRGQSVVFDKTSQTFHIPDNTRFYKTFAKQIVDGNGNMTYRKIETRLIVARADTDPPPGTSGETVQNALFGTYVWNDDESAATLLKDPLRDGTPFSDRLLTYFTDEQMAQQIIAANADPTDALAAVPDLVRHYALPGRDRCIDCHMGSPSADFVLGFTPLQVNRRATNTGGTYEPATGDELTQLQRFIDYGIVTGLTSATDPSILPLEQVEGTRTPRNSYELAAQAYMTGNCAHCHNPRGFPTKKAPLLKDVLNFLPSAIGGVFQFPLERTSPVRQRGPSQTTPVPYITPSLYDYPSVGHHGKWIDCVGDTYDEVCTSKDPVFFLAPWRALIYRNVDTPFDYVEDETIFPHMPMNSAGYDCRVAHIMGDWMTSIPATLKSPSLVEAATFVKAAYPANVDTDPQPYVEVTPDMPGYQDAVAAAAMRMDAYHKGHRYDFCPDTSDILDPWIVNETDNNLAVTPDVEDGVDPMDPTKVLWPNSKIAIPIKPHWVVTDTTDPPPPWNPRRPDWANALLQGDPGDTSALEASDAEALANVVAALQTTTVTSDIRTVLTTKVPFGIWEQKAGCNFTGIPTVGSYQGRARPQWMDVSRPDPSTPVYQEYPGAAVFNTICFNCHGPLANAQGLLADEIALMTGGDARVADFRDGLLGPLSAPGTNRMPIFIDPKGVLTTDDITARYVAWMALGGTLKHLPSQLLDLVSNTPVQGIYRNGKYINPVGTPDMLRLGLELCTDILASNYNVQVISLNSFFAGGRIDWADQTPLIDKNGDAELWLKLCGLGNRPVVRVPVVSWDGGTTTSAVQIQGNGSHYWADAYPANAPVMDQRGNVTNGIQPDNLYPICMRKPADPTAFGYADSWLAGHTINGNRVPWCPDALFPSSNPDMYKLAFMTDALNNPNFIDAKKWGARGAINAGMAVFLYLDSMERGTTPVLPNYDQCDQLMSTPAQ
jgi:mono/diheme cytochrome c family protein